MSFDFEVQTTGANDTFTLPLASNGTYNFNVAWGDGSDDDITTWDDVNKTHTYATEDLYNVVITGTITGWAFNNSSSAPKIRDVSDWGSLDVGANQSWFYGCANMTNSASGTFGVSSIVSMNSAFRTCTNLDNFPDTTAWDLSSVTQMVSTFNGCSTVTSPPITGVWDVSNITSMASSFSSCTSLTSPPDVASWNIRKVTNISSMFAFCSSMLAPPDVSGWDTINLTNLSSTFRNCSSMLTPPDISNWNTKKVTTFASTFLSCSSMSATLDISKLNISSVTTMASFLSGSSILTDLNYSKALVYWSQLSLNSGVSAHFNGAKYYKGPPTNQRTYMDVTLSWTITDGGQANEIWPSNIDYIQSIKKDVLKSVIHNITDSVLLPAMFETGEIPTDNEISTNFTLPGLTLGFEIYNTETSDVATALVLPGLTLGVSVKQKNNVSAGLVLPGLTLGIETEQKNKINSSLVLPGLTLGINVDNAETNSVNTSFVLPGITLGMNVEQKNNINTNFILPGLTLGMGVEQKNKVSANMILPGITLGFNIESVYPIPAAPTNPAAAPRNTKVAITWTNSLYAMSYNIYWAATPGVTGASSKIEGVQSGYVHTDRTNGQPYYYRISAVNEAGESDLSTEVTATPVYQEEEEKKGLYIGIGITI